jgi:List-Bact-rpt repeat protein
VRRLPTALLIVVAAALVVAAAPTAGESAASAARWCGAEPTAADRLPDLARGGRQIHVVFAYPADASPDLADASPRLVAEAQAMDAWWRREDPSRTPRFDRFPAPGCEEPLGDLDISHVQLPRSGSAYAGCQSSLNAFSTCLIRDLVDARGFPERGPKKYLVYYAGPIQAPCGSGGTWFAMAFLGNACGSGFGEGGDATWVATHELLHGLGAVPAEAPHVCGPAHVCDSPADIMNAYARHPALADATLDVGRDDYYGHGGSWLDVRRSFWLARLDAPPATLTVEVAGRGKGTVSSDEGTIACPPRCSAELDPGYPLTLTVDAGSGSTLLEWGGACTGSEPCALTAEGAMTVTALIEPATQRLRMAVSGSGRIVSSEGSCRRRCSLAASTDSAVTFRARPAAGWRFVRWTGGCTGVRPRCTLVVHDPVTVSARFRRRAR